MKLILLFIILTFNINGFCLDTSFEFKFENNLHILVEKNSQEQIPINMAGPENPKILKIKKQDNFLLVYFYAGSAGTFDLIRHEKVAIFNTKKGQFLEKVYVTKLGDLPEKDQPTLKISNGKIIYNLPK